jgi:hypothetical protein
MMCNQFAIKKEKTHDYYAVDGETQLFIAFPYKERGYSKEKMMKIAERLPMLGGLKNGLHSSNVELIMAPNLDETIEKLKEKTKEYLKSKTKIIHIGGTQRDN